MVRFKVSVNVTVGLGVDIPLRLGLVVRIAFRVGSR
jgi:hypothetical protein